MKTRHVLAPLAAAMTGAAALAMFLVPDGRADPTLDRGAVGAAAEPESILDGWANRDLDIGRP